MQSTTTQPKIEGDTTIKVPRIIHQELIQEFEKYGFRALSQYTTHIFKNRSKIMEVEAINSPVQTQSPVTQNLGIVPDASQPWQQTNKPQPQGIFVSNEDYYALKSNQEAYQKEREERGRLSHTVQVLSGVIDVLIEEAAAHSGSLLKNYDKAYYEQVALKILQKEGIQI